MDVSFSANTWKHFEIQNLDLKLQEQFYASTPYNLNDFKQTSKPPCPIFQTIDSNLLQHNNALKKKLIKKENISLAVFVTYLYQFFHQVKIQIQKKSNHPQTKTKIPSQPHLKLQNQTTDNETEKQTDRKLFFPQKAEKETKSEEFEVLKNIKLKIYEIDLCKLKAVPNKFMKYYNNNLLKKIIFQYLSKALYNISLVEILLESNQILCFALSLVSQSLLAKKDKISTFNENQNFYDEAFGFLQHFDSFDDPCIQSARKSEDFLPSSLSTQSKYQANKAKGTQNNLKAQSFMNFALTQKQMKSKYSSLRQEGFQGTKTYILALLDSKKPVNNKVNSPHKKINAQNKQLNSLSKQSPNKVKTVTNVKLSPKKPIPSSKSIKLKSDKKIKEVEEEKGWMRYLGCLKYFFSDSPKI